MSELPRPIADSKTFYRTISYKASFAELWRDARSPAVLILWVTKICRIAVRGIPNDPPVPSLLPFAVASSELPTAALAHLQAMAKSLAGSGFASSPIAYFLIEDLVNNCRFYLCLLLSDDRKTVARLTARVTAVRTLKNARRIVELISPMTNGTLLCSTNSHCYQDAPPGIRLNPEFEKPRPSSPHLINARKSQALMSPPSCLAIWLPSIWPSDITAKPSATACGEVSIDRWMRAKKQRRNTWCA